MFEREISLLSKLGNKGQDPAAGSMGFIFLRQPYKFSISSRRNKEGASGRHAAVGCSLKMRGWGGKRGADGRGRKERRKI